MRHRLPPHSPGCPAASVRRHPTNSRRQAVISGKYGGGVCTLSDDMTCLWLCSTQHNESDFHEGDTVIVALKQYDYKRQLITAESQMVKRSPDSSSSGSCPDYLWGRGKSLNR